MRVYTYVYGYGCPACTTSLGVLAPLFHPGPSSLWRCFKIYKGHPVEGIEFPSSFTKKLNSPKGALYKLVISLQFSPKN